MATQKPKTREQRRARRDVVQTPKPAPKPAEQTAFDRARDAIVAMWERMKDEDQGAVDEEMLVVADALEEAGLDRDAAWLRASFRRTWTADSSGMVFVGKSVEEVKAMRSPPPPVKP